MGRMRPRRREERERGGGVFNNPMVDSDSKRQSGGITKYIAEEIDIGKNKWGNLEKQRKPRGRSSRSLVVFLLLLEEK
jgi:hypothetical protein